MQSWSTASCNSNYNFFFLFFWVNLEPRAMKDVGKQILYSLSFLVCSCWVFSWNDFFQASDWLTVLLLHLSIFRLLFERLCLTKTSPCFYFYSFLLLMYLLYILQQMLSGWEKCQIQRCQLWCRVLDLVACSVTAEQMFTNFWVEQQRTDEIEGFLLLLFVVFFSGASF